MTYRRQIGSVEFTLTGALDLLTAHEVRAATGKEMATLAGKSNPHHPSKLTFEEAAQLDRALREKGETAPFLPLFLDMSGATDRRLQIDLGREVIRAMADIGAMVSHYDQALADGEVDEHEDEQLRADAQAAIGHLQAILNRPKPERRPAASVSAIPVKGRVG